MPSILHPSPQLSAARVGRRWVVSGIVQGIGFRPAIANQATALRLTGIVRNSNEGVCIEVEGNAEDVAAFGCGLRQRLDRLDAVTMVEEFDLDPVGRTSFVIAASDPSGPIQTAIPLDRNVCDACLREIKTPGNRRYRYPFTSCAVCGPRFSILREMPFDRDRTEMAPFIRCADCEAEYRNPADRRFHAETISCPACGPRVWLREPSSTMERFGEEAIVGAVAAILRGEIVAIKGIGGYQLVCDATQESVVNRLRARKQRPSKPFAVMVGDVKEANRYAEVSSDDARLLSHWSGPIVILKRRLQGCIAPSVYGSQWTLGVMLPTTPLHALIAEACKRPLVVTSGNVEGEPLEYEPVAAENRLACIADQFLHHDRGIVHPIDDSVVRWIQGQMVTIRAGRGMAPLRLAARGDRHAIALGGGQKVAIAVNTPGQIMMAPHFGEVESIASCERFVDYKNRMQGLLACRPLEIAHDLHDDYSTTRFARASRLTTVPIQHHHAHVVAVMAEYGILDKEVIGVAFDGTGLGDDGTIWGGEFLIARAADYRRVGHLRSFRVVGGDAVIRQPWRSTLSLMVHCGDPSLIAGLRQRWIGVDFDGYQEALKQDRWSLATSSTGRLFDGVAAWLLDRPTADYEGELARCLEGICDSSCVGEYRFAVQRIDHQWQLDWRSALKAIQGDLHQEVSVEAIAMRFHRGLATGIAEVCRRIADDRHRTIILCGGVFQNRILTECVSQRLTEMGLNVRIPCSVPIGDGGIAVGQAAIALASHCSGAESQMTEEKR